MATRNATTNDLTAIFIGIMLSLLVISIGIILNQNARFDHLEKKLIKSETITVYTADDILYLEDTRIYSESGKIDINAGTRNTAINIFEQLTVPNDE